jgi:cytochrome c551/c552
VSGNGWKSRLVESSAFIAVAAIAFVGGLLIGDLGASPKTETVVATPSSEGEEAGGAEVEEESGGAAAGGNAQMEGGAQVFTSAGCGSCHTFKAANSTGTTGPDLNEFLAPDDDKAGIEEMITDPNAEIAEGFSANVMPQEYGQALSKQELEQLVDFLFENSPAGE